ncbi:MAG: hypothetical protein QOG82_1557 [Actinomycetota bacterium]|nr:hypothetical protein [Actinomycetota bacterium]
MKPRERTTISPLGALFRGTTAGAVGTAAMDLLLYRRYRRGGGSQGLWEWELSGGLSDWDGAPAPALVGRRLVEGLFQTDLSPRWARTMNNLTHWGFGKLWGGGYGLVAGSTTMPPVLSGLALGSVVWGQGYVVLPLAKLYRPIWEYDAKTLANDYSAHLVYGVTTALAFRALTAGGKRTPGGRVRGPCRRSKGLDGAIAAP